MLKGESNMNDLKSFAEYLKTKRLRDLAVEYLRIIKSMDIPLVRLVYERNVYPDLTEEKSIEMTMIGLDKFLVSVVNGTMLEQVQEGLKKWEEDKLPVPGISKHDILPSDLVLIYAAQKRALFKFMPDFTIEAAISVAIITELETFYMQALSDATQMIFKIQKEIEHKLKESEERNRQIVEAVKDYAIFMLNAEGYVKSWNEGLKKIKGYSADEIIGKHFSIFYTKEDIEKGIPEYNLKMSKKLGHFESEGLRVRKDGSLFWADVVITPLYDDGKLTGFTKVTKDITEIKKAKEDLESKAKELARSNTELEQFAYVASHDLQEPLRTVSSYVQLLANRYKNKLDKDANEFIDFAVDGSNRMRQLINSLLEYSRINRVKPFEEIYVSDIISDVLVDLSDQVNSTGAIIKYDNLPETIYGDNVLIGQLFQNLIANALKFRNSAKPEIEISCERHGSQYLFSVKDNGIGMEREYWDKIFAIFQRLNSREKYPGTGIGLSICKKIVERHGGKIWVESKLGIGSTFYFTINKSTVKKEPVMISENAKKDRHIIN